MQSDVSLAFGQCAIAPFCLLYKALELDMAALPKTIQPSRDNLKFLPECFSRFGSSNVSGTKSQTLAYLIVDISKSKLIPTEIPSMVAGQVSGVRIIRIVICSFAWMPIAIEL
jgi:hypothetical protein